MHMYINKFETDFGRVILNYLTVLFFYNLNNSINYS